MISIRFASAFAAAALLSMASVATAQDSSSVQFIPTPTATVPASAMSTIGCFSTGTPLDDHGKGYFTSPGSCQQICLGLGKDVLGLSEGDHCWCGDYFPPEDTQVDNSTCNTKCAGTQAEICGGKGKLWVMTTGNSLNEIDFFDPKSISSSAAPSKTAGPAGPSKPAGAAETVLVTQSSTPAAAPESSGPNKGAIAAGAVIGVVALAAIIGGVFFYLRQKKRREVEEEYRRQAAVNSFVSGGKLHTSNSSMTDSRLDPEFMARRQSNGSIADNEDYSRRILKVTNV